MDLIQQLTSTSTSNERDNDLEYTELDQLIEKYDYFMFDCDGVLWSGDHQINNSIKALQYIVSHPNKQIFLITNNSSKSRQTIVEDKMAKFGFKEFPIDNVYCSGYVAARYLKHFLSDQDSVYVIGEKGLKQELKNLDIRVINETDEREHGLEMGCDEFSSIEVDPSVKAVVAGINYSFNYRKLCMASLYLELNNAKFIATNQDRNFSNTSQNRNMPAGGSIVEAIEFSTKVKPFLIGKPQTLFFETIREDHKLQDKPLNKFIMVGDNLSTDILFGNNCGIDTMLVLSGNTDKQKCRKVFIDGVKEKDDGVPTYVSPYLAYNKQF